MPKFQISGVSLHLAPQAAVSYISGSAYLLVSLSIFLIELITSRAAGLHPAVPTFASESPDSPLIASAA
jgi:hypothetical protein